MAMTISGLDGLKANLAALREHMNGPGAVNAVRAGGSVIRAAMRDRTPILIDRTEGSNALPPGTVKRSIGVRFPQKEQLFETTALIGPGKAGRRVAHLVEYGHRMVTGGKSRLNSFGAFVGSGTAAEVDVPAHPFLRPAFEESIAAAKEALAETLAAELKEGVK
jgi:HK97 gp10 family phage protein